MKVEHLPAETSPSDIHAILARDGCVVIDKLLSESLVVRGFLLDDYWRYGIDANRKELDSIMRYTHEQGLVY